MSIGTNIATRWLNGNVEDVKKETKRIIQRINRMNSKELSENYTAFVSVISQASEPVLKKLSHELARTSVPEDFEHDGSYYIFSNLISAFENRQQDNLEPVLSNFNPQGIEKIDQGIEKIDLVLKSTLIEMNDRTTFEQVKILCETDPLFACKNFTDFNIGSPEERFELAKICFHKTSEASGYISSFKLKEDKRMELAYIAMNRTTLSQEKLIENLSKFEISNDKEIYDIIVRCAADIPAIVAAHIQNFQITSEEKRIAIAKLCALNVESIPGFSLDIVKILKNLSSFEINHEDLVKILVLLAKKNSEAVAEYLEDLGINDPKELSNLVWRFAHQDPLNILCAIKYFKITDQEELHKLGIYCALHSGIKSASRLENCGFKQNPYAVKCIHSIDEEEFDEILPILKNWIRDAFIDTNLIKICENIEKIDNPQIKNEKTLFFMECLFLMNTLLSKEQVQWCCEKQNLVEKILNFQSPTTRLPMAREIISNLMQPNYLTSLSNVPITKKNADWITFVTLLMGGFHNRGVSKATVEKLFQVIVRSSNTIFYAVENNQVLIEVLINLLNDVNLSISEKESNLLKVLNEVQDSSSQISKEIVKAKIKLEIVDDLSKIIQSNSELRDKKEVLNEILNRLDQSIFSVKDIKALEDKRNVCFTSEITSNEELNKQIKLFLAFLAPPKIKKRWEKTVQQENMLDLQKSVLQNMKTLNSILLIHPESLKSSALGLNENLQKLIQESLPLGNIENFSEKYSAVFGKHSQALMTYIAKIVSLNDTEALQSLANYVSAALMGKFETTRNDLTYNPHLQLIAQKKPELLNKWFETLEPKKIVIDTPKDSQKTREFVIKECMDPVEILTIGKCGNTCQSVDKAVVNNKGLLGYLLDGKIRVFVIQNQENEIVSRCILKLLWDGDNPIIYQERIYRGVGISDFSTELEATLVEMTREKAEHLGVPLVKDYDKKNKPYEKKLKSIGGPARFEYCDNPGGAVGWGKFEIEKCSYVQ